MKSARTKPGIGKETRKFQEGFALLIALIALALVSAIGMYQFMIAASEIRISDNFESYVLARAAALAGLGHGRALLRGLSFDDLLRGPDGTYDATPAGLASARRAAFRTPVPWPAARMLDMADPAGALTGAADDGILNTGRHPGGNGAALIPGTGIALSGPDPSGPGMRIISRYFVKASDNNGEASELAVDPLDNPFLDGDGQILLRSMGIAQTLGEELQGKTKRNSVTMFEGKYRRTSTFDLDAPLVLQGSGIEPAEGEMFVGPLFFVQGGPANAGIAAIDAEPSDGLAPVPQITDWIARGQEKQIQGAGLEPSVQEITAAILANPDKRLLLDKSWLQGFIRESLPQFSDNFFSGQQIWAGAAPAPLGRIDPAQAPGAPVQDPKVTLVDGDLTVDGSLEGGGLLVVTGRLAVKGGFVFNGLVLVIGSGEIDIGGWSRIAGGIYVVCLPALDPGAAWGTVKLTVQEGGHVLFDRVAIRMALRLIPPAQVGFREITSIIDPES